MQELKPYEFSILKQIDHAIGLYDKEGIDTKNILNILVDFSDVSPLYRNACKSDIAQIISELVKKNILTFSPDGTKFKLTNYGNELFSNKIKEEENWINQGPFIKLRPEKKEEINVKQGEYFKGYWEIINILKRAKKTIKIQDAYIGTDTIAMLNELNETISIQILTSDKNWKHKDLALTSFLKFKKDRKGTTELRINNLIHSRRIIIDDLEVYSCDDSLKDIGIHKASKIIRLNKIDEELDNYNIAWKEAKLTEY